MDIDTSPDEANDLRRLNWRERLRRLRPLLWAFAFLLAIDVALRAFMYPDLTGDATLRRLAAFRDCATTTSTQIVLMGSSMLKCVDLTDVWDGSSANLSFNGGSCEGLDIVRRQYLSADALNRNETELVVLGVDLFGLNDSRYNHFIIGNLWSPGDGARHFADFGFDDRIRSYVFWRFPFRESGLVRARLVGGLRDKLRIAVYTALGKLQNRGEARERDDATTTVTVPKERVLPPPPGLTAAIANYGGRKIQRPALRRCVAELKASGVEVAIVAPPVSDWYAQVYTDQPARFREMLTDVGRELDVPVFIPTVDEFDLDDWDFASGDFLDGIHILTDDGQRRFSRWIVDEIVAPIMSPDGPRGFALSGAGAP